MSAVTERRAALHDRPLAEVDPEVARAVARELERQRTTLEMIALGRTSRALAVTVS